MSEMLILQKSVDQSVLREGMSIPALFQQMFYQKSGLQLAKGESITINLILGNGSFQATLKNYDFDQDKYPGHPDVLQIRYSPNSPLAIKLREVFSSTNELVQEFLKSRTDRKKQFSIPNEKKEYLAIYGTPVKGTLFVDCITRDEYQKEAQEILQLDERSYENAVDADAKIVERIGVKKIRRITKAIGDNLKILYGYRCQICGAYIGEKYGSTLIHAHHIEYFTKSLNNNADNIMIVCPNHHGIIHDRNPQYNREKKTYLYPNGYQEGLALNLHL